MHLTKSLLIAMAILTACNPPAPKQAAAVTDTKPVEEKVFIIPPIKDTSSIHGKLRPLTAHSLVFPMSRLPDTLRRQYAEDLTTTYTSDTVKLHVKGDSCWLEYVSAGKVHAKKKDGTLWEDIAETRETTDTVIIR
jgi:hypothetical protein